MGSKDAPLGNISTKTYFLKTELKVIKKIKLGRRKPQTSSPFKHAGGVSLLTEALNKVRNSVIRAMCSHTVLQQGAVRKAKASTAGRAELEAAQGISVLQCHLVGITATPARLEYSRHRAGASQLRKRSFNIF